MGVKGLQSFLKNNQALISDGTNLHDTQLVIDGNNLLCQLYVSEALDKSSPYYRNDIYGGDFVHYGDAVRAFFDKLKQCNIKPVILFDGSVIGKSSLKEFVASKEKETYRRGLERFKKAQNFTETPNDDELMLPQTIVAVFRDIVTELDIERIQTAYEADAHIARVANERNCPVLTNDSDFIIYNLKQGFILLDWFQHKTIVKDAAGRSCISCYLFSQKKFFKSLPNLKPECLPLLSALLGNDYVESGTFDQITTAVCRQTNSSRFEARSFTHRRIINLLCWLSNCGSLENAIERLINIVHRDRQERLRSLLTKLVRNYQIEKVDDFEDELDEIYNRDRNLLEANHLVPSRYLKRLMLDHDLGAICLDMIFHNTYYNYSMVDDVQLHSSSYPNYRPYSLALVLLRPEPCPSETPLQRRMSSEKYSFYIYDRQSSEYTKLVIRPMERLENFGSLEHLDCYSVITLEPKLKSSLLMECFRFNNEEFFLMSDIVMRVFDGIFAKEVTICMILLKYIGIETRIAPKPQFIDALLVTFFFYAACSGGLNGSVFPDAGNYGSLLLQLRSHSLMKNNIDYGSNNESLFRAIMHFISELHTTYHAYRLINALLAHPCHQARPSLFLNGTLIYRLTKLFRLGNMKLNDLCKTVPPFLDLCDSVKVIVSV